MPGVMRSEFTEAMKMDSYGYFFDAQPTAVPVYEQLFEIVSSDAA